MSGLDRLTQMRGLLLIHCDGGLTCEMSPELGAVFSLSSLFSLQEHQGPMKRTKIHLSQRYWHLFFWFVWNPIASQPKQGFNLPLLKYDECYYTQERMKTSVILLSKYRSWKVQFNIYNIICEKQKICHAFHFPPPICNEFQAATCLWCRHFCNGLSSSCIPRLTAPPLISRAELFCNICWCGSASKCCRIVLLLELFFFADRRGKGAPPTSSAAACKMSSSFTFEAHVWGQKREQSYL